MLYGGRSDGGGPRPPVSPLRHVRKMPMLRLAILDDYARVARSMADWSVVETRQYQKTAMIRSIEVLENVANINQHVNI